MAVLNPLQVPLRDADFTDKSGNWWLAVMARNDYASVQLGRQRPETR